MTSQIFASHTEDDMDAAAVVQAVAVERQAAAAAAGGAQGGDYVCRAAFDSDQVTNAKAHALDPDC